MKMNPHTQSQMTESMLLPQLKSKKDLQSNHILKYNKQCIHKQSIF